MKISSSISALRKAVSTSIFSNSQSNLAANARTVLIDVNLATGAKVSP
jgi:hypothetical protein